MVRSIVDVGYGVGRGADDAASMRVGTLRGRGRSGHRVCGTHKNTCCSAASGADTLNFRIYDQIAAPTVGTSFDSWLIVRIRSSSVSTSDYSDDVGTCCAGVEDGEVDV